MGLCRFHDQRRRTGVPLDAPPRASRARSADGWIHKGYRWITVEDGREVMEHRHIMEKSLNKRLGYDEVIHHINGDKLDNRIENLEVLSRAEHTSHHRPHQTPCRECGILDPHGTRGLCAIHQQQLKKFRRLFFGY